MKTKEDSNYLVRATKEELLEAAFSVQSVPKLYNEDIRFVDKE
jgi:hypothetical protein